MPSAACSSHLAAASVYVGGYGLKSLFVPRRSHQGELCDVCGVPGESTGCWNAKFSILSRAGVIALGRNKRHLPCAPYCAPGGFEDTETLLFRAPKRARMKLEGCTCWYVRQQRGELNICLLLLKGGDEMSKNVPQSEFMDCLVADYIIRTENLSGRPTIETEKKKEHSVTRCERLLWRSWIRVYQEETSH